MWYDCWKQEQESVFLSVSPFIASCSWLIIISLFPFVLFIDTCTGFYDSLVPVFLADSVNRRLTDFENFSNIFEVINFGFLMIKGGCFLCSFFSSTRFVMFLVGKSPLRQWKLPLKFFPLNATLHFPCIRCEGNDNNNVAVKIKANNRRKQNGKKLTSFFLIL